MEQRRVEEAEKGRQQQIQLKELETTLAKMTSNLEDKRLEEQREAREEAKQDKRSSRNSRRKPRQFHCLGR